MEFDLDDTAKTFHNREPKAYVTCNGEKIPVDMSGIDIDFLNKETGESMQFVGPATVLKN